MELQEAISVKGPPTTSKWGLVMEGLRGSSRDFTEGHVGHAILVLAVPMVAEMCMESLFAVVDIFFVSRLGSDAVSTVGLTEAMLTIVYSVAIALCIGATATVARRVGEKDQEGASLAAVQVIALGVIVSAAIGLVGALNAQTLLAWMGASQTMQREMVGYTAVMLGGNATVMLLFLLNAIFRGAGDATIAMRVLWMANGINIVLGPLFIFGLGPFPELGVMGAAIATNIGRGTAVVVQLTVLLSGTSRIHVARRHLRLMPQVMWNMCRLSGSGLVQILISTTSWIGLVRIIAVFGSDALAGYTIAMRTIVFALLPSWGLSNAAATMVGQGLGAGKPDRAEHAVWTAAYYNMWFLGSVGALFIIFAPQIVAIYTSDPNVAGHAVSALRIVSSGYLFYAYGMVLTQAFNGAGDTWTPTRINLACFWCWEVPLAWLLALKLGMGPVGVYIAITVAFSTLAVVSAVLFRQGKWKVKKV